jgi:hypothetical protein
MTYKILISLMVPMLTQCSDLKEDKLTDLEKKEDVEIIHVRKITPENLPKLMASFQSSFNSPGDGRLTRTKRVGQRSSHSIDFDLDAIPVVSDEDKK